MENACDEIAGSQLGGAIPPYNLDDLSQNISDIDILVVNFCKKPTKRKKTRDRFLGSLLGMLDEANEQLVSYREDLIQNKCIEPFKVSSERNDNDDEDFWKYIGILFEEIKHEEVYQSLKDKVTRFRLLLADVESAMRNCDPIVFEKFFFRVKPGGIEDGVVKHFHRMIYENQPITKEKLIVMQSQAVIKALGKGIFDFAGKASRKEVKEVSPNLETDFVPCDFEITDGFKNKYALFRRYTYKRGKMLILNYEKYGKYIVDHKYQFKEEQFKAIFELDVMLREIRMEMERLNPELASTIAEQPANNQPEGKEELFHFIHPEIDEEEAWRIHKAIKRLVLYQKVPEICAYLKNLSQKIKLLLPPNPSFVYEELVRLGMPTGDGYSEKYFTKCYKLN